jgi:hypothetical protein
VRSAFLGIHHHPEEEEEESKLFADSYIIYII